jgi:hypothetical protein
MNTATILALVALAWWFFYSGYQLGCYISDRRNSKIKSQPLPHDGEWRGLPEALE